MTTARIRKTAKKTPEVKKPREGSHVQFGIPIETDKIKVNFDGLTVTYTLKATGEVVSKEYDNVHALMIIYGRIRSEPHGEYTQHCVNKARQTAMKLKPNPIF